MPYPEGGNPASCLENSLILSELNYNNDQARSEFKNLFLSMTEEKCHHATTTDHAIYRCLQQ
ncbi:hypothetical protein JHK87_006800 [Glycine soja]|nr:hypothetical protein JHK87_006800 [Glycine soja]